MRSFYSDKIEHLDSCRQQLEQLTFCESPCVVQVGLSVVRVTFNKYLVKTECVKEASIVYWISNRTEESSNEMILNNHEKIYPKDCTYHKNSMFNLKGRDNLNVHNASTAYRRNLNRFETPLQNDNRYVYVYGLSAGAKYSIKTKIVLKTQIRNRSVFSSIPTEIILSKNELFQNDGLLGHVNQRRCCEIKNFTYEIEPRTGECRFEMPISEAHTRLSTFVMTSLVIIAVCIAVVGITIKYCITIARRRNIQIDGYNLPEVSFQYLDSEEIYHDLSTTRRHFTLNPKLLRSPTIANRLPPDGEEIEFEELNKKFKCQSI